jgi:hypothetical protein
LKVAGATYDDIARSLGFYDKSHARQAVLAGLKESLQQAGTEEFREIERERLERLHLSRWKRTLDGDDDAAALVLQAARQRAALLGLNAPVKLQHAGDPENPVVVKVVKGVRMDEL